MSTYFLISNPGILEYQDLALCLRIPTLVTEFRKKEPSWNLTYLDFWGIGGRLTS
jgi:hypothetical protein